MYNYIENRILEEAKFFIYNGSTIRATAKAFNISKSAVHVDLSKRLWKISPSLARQVRLILDKNIEERACRGGNAKRKKCQDLKKIS